MLSSFILSIVFVNFANDFDKRIFFMGQLSVFATAAIRRSLSSRNIPHSSSMCSAVWLPFPHGQSAASMVLNLCRCDFMFPWPVTRVVTCSWFFSSYAS